MSNLTQILELLLAEDNEKAEEMLHEYVVAKARAEYERVLDESDDEEVDETYDMTNDFEDDILDDEDEIDADEIGENEEEFDDEGGDMDADFGMDDEGGDMDADFGMDDEGGEFDDEGEDDIEDKVDSLEAELEDLRAEFEQLMAGDDEGEDEFATDDEMDFDADSEDEYSDDEGEEEVMDSVEYDLDEEFEDDDDVVEEATQFSKKNIKPDMSGDTDAANNKSPYTQAPKPSVHTQAKPFRNNDGSDGKKGGEKKNHTPTNNINVDHKKGPAVKDAKTNVDGGAKASPFTKKPK